MISRPLIAAALAVVGLATAMAPSAARAHALAGVVRDVPTGTHIVLGQIASKRGNLPYGGGRVLHSNRTHAIFWEPAGSGLAFEPGYESLIETFLVDVAADSHRTSNVYGLSGQYADADGPAAYDSTYGGAVVANDPLPANGCTEPAMTGPGWTLCLTDAQLETEIQHVIAADHLPTSGRDVYFLITPNGLGSCTDARSSSCALGGSVSGYCGYHSQTVSGVPYAIIPYNAVRGHCQSSNPRPNSNPADPTISTVSHEHNEMVTDPDGDAWIDRRGNEDGDLCLTSFGPKVHVSDAIPWNETVHGGHFFLQEEWSNADHGCAPRARPDALWFGWGHAAAGVGSVSFTAHGSDPQGRMVTFQWFFGDGRAGFGRHASHTFRGAGTYRVVLRSTDSWGNWTFAARTIRVTGG